MARARLLKPSFFKNEELADLGMAARLLFSGLWCLADREGRLEDRPRRIKADVLPYDDCDVDALLDALHERGFIRRYATGADRFILVLNFRKHQTPHVKEAPSTIPAPDEPDANTSAAPPLTLNPIPEALTGSLDVDDGADDPPAAAAIPERVCLMHEILVGQPGYDPSPRFLQKVGATFGHLDLEAEALKIASWMKTRPKNKRELCSTRRVLNWLEEAERRRLEAGNAAARNGTYGTNGGKPDNGSAARPGVRHG